MPGENANPSLPSLMTFCQSRMPALLAAVDGRRLLQTVADIVANDLWNSFDGFHRTNQMLLAAYEACGAKTQLHTIPTGGLRGNGKWIIPEAEDFRAATLDLVEPVERRLLDYRECPWHVVQWSAATPQEGITCELAVVDSEEQFARASGTLAGKIVLTRMNARESREKFSAAGAAGLLFDPPVAGFPGAVAWTKFGWGGLDLGNGGAPMVGFAISSTLGDELRELHRRHGRLVVHARLDVRRYAGSHGVVSGLIPGREDPDVEIWAVAHSAEPGALDNASGVAACVEIARAINGLIKSGQLPLPRRTIRLLHGYECYGFFHYLEHVKRLQPPLAGVCIDTIGARPDLCGGELRWHASALGSASFADDIGATILSHALDQRPVYRFKRMPFLSTEDTLLGDPEYGFPCPWITNHPFRGYHSSADTIDSVDEQGLAVSTAAMAGYLYYLADMGTSEAIEVARDQTTRAAAPLENGDDLSPALVTSIRQSHSATVRRLGRFVWTGDHSTLANEFDGLAGRVTEVAKAAGDKSKNIGDASSSSFSDPRARLIPLRRLPLAPTPENVWPHVLTRLGESFPKWAVYWADGERSISDIAPLLALDAEVRLELPSVIAHFEALAELGYVDLIHPDQFATEESLAADFVALGVRPGMNVLVHSSLKSIGPVRGGAAAVVRALLSALGPDGTLLAPSFNHFDAGVFNPLTTPTTNGAIPEAIWRHADARRSLHPSHSVAAIGLRAEHYLRDHITNGVWSADSPIGRLMEAGGHVLSIGVGHDRSTAYHLAEISLKAPCLDSFGSVDRIVDADGHMRSVPSLAWRAAECPVDPNGLDALLESKQARGFIGLAASTLARAADIFAARRDQLGDRCAQCPIRPEYRNTQQKAGGATSGFETASPPTN
ncbi:MAG TPA: AAC(3) family N-acetyltransferase [Tepidisphaeraceae bacterium]|jgi:aminoglycoside 3-N-acetyltransferase|nr:AAC(3) family N-acetyltransferase [Tepidisphaeraceae bacterium]